jgi:hypothetical protein
MAEEKRKRSNEGGPTESSMPDTRPEPGDAADRAQQDDPNNYTPGNSDTQKVDGRQQGDQQKSNGHDRSRGVDKDQTYKGNEDATEDVA